MQKLSEVDEILHALEAAVAAYGQHLTLGETLPPQYRLRFANLGLDIARVEQKTRQLVVELRTEGLLPPHR